MAARLRATLSARLAVLAVVAVALAYIEASVVVYLRQVIVPVREIHFPSAVREVLPLLSPEQLEQAGHEVASLLVVEVIREITPIAVLLAVAWGLSRRKAETTALFMIGFALWDVFYYGFLKILLDWPASLTTWDVLYLIPTAWVAPVWAPLVVSVTLLLGGMAILHRSGRHQVAKGPLWAWLLVVLGVGLVLASFLLRTKEAFQAAPVQFDWPWFLAGWLSAVGGMVWLLRSGSSRA